MQKSENRNESQKNGDQQRQKRQIRHTNKLVSSKIENKRFFGVSIFKKINILTTNKIGFSDLYKIECDPI